MEFIISNAALGTLARLLDFFREVFLFSRVFVEKKQARCFYTAGLLLFMHIASGVAKQSLVTIHLSTVSATTR